MRVATITLCLIACAAFATVVGPWSVQTTSAFFCGCSEESCYDFFGRPVTVRESAVVTGVSNVDCHWAHMEANRQLNAIAVCGLGFCQHQRINVNPPGPGEPCNFSTTGTWTVQKKVRWSCKTCLGFFTPCP